MPGRAAAASSSSSSSSSSDSEDAPVREARPAQEPVSTSDTDSSDSARTVGLRALNQLNAIDRRNARSPAKKSRRQREIGAILCKTAVKNGWREEGNTSERWQDHKDAWKKIDKKDHARLAYPPPAWWLTENHSAGADAWHAKSLEEKKKLFKSGARSKKKRKETQKPGAAAAAQETSARPTSVLNGMMAHEQGLVDEAVDVNADPATPAKPPRKKKKHTRGAPTDESTIDYKVGWLESRIPKVFGRVADLYEEVQHPGAWTTTAALFLYTDLPKLTAGRVNAHRPCPRVWTFASPHSSGSIKAFGTRRADKGKPPDRRELAQRVQLRKDELLAAEKALKEFDEEHPSTSAAAGSDGTAAGKRRPKTPPSRPCTIVNDFVSRVRARMNACVWTYV